MATEILEAKETVHSILGCARFVTEIVMRYGIWHQVTSGKGNLGSEGDKVQARCQL